MNSFKLARVRGFLNSKDIKFFCWSCCYVVMLLLCLFAGLTLITGCAVKGERTYAQKTGELSVIIDGFHNDEGKAILSLFAQEDGFPDDMDKAWQNLQVKIESGRAQALFAEVPYGEYALSILHDEDGDKRMQSGWLGQPREGFGFSGRPDYNFGPPAFSDAAFLLISSTREIVARMRYDTVRQKKQIKQRTVQDGKQ